MKLVFATNNRHKLEEVRQIVGEGMEILSLADIGCNADIPEDGATLEENAVQKALWVKEHYGYDCFADDTGLEVEALGGEPGVHSARYASEQGHDSEANKALLLQNMKGIGNRRARFRTVIALAVGDEMKKVDGIVNGVILVNPEGNEGFGYDPLFKPEGFEVSFAQMSAEDKNKISHRGRAMRKLMVLLKELTE